MLLHLYDHVACAINYFSPILNHDFISGCTATIQVHMYVHQGQVPPPPFTYMSSYCRVSVYEQMTEQEVSGFVNLWIHLLLWILDAFPVPGTL